MFSMDDIADAPEAGGFDAYYGLLAPAQTVLVRAYGDDGDDRLLAELRPRFVVLFEPALEFVRRVEVYRAGAPGLNVRVYFMVWQLSAEEHKFLAAQRREKDAFERLIRERGVRPVFRPDARVLMGRRRTCCSRSSTTARARGPTRSSRRSRRARPAAGARR
jgi:hypothetical protein